MAELPTPAEIIARLDLRPHPEGGHYRETFRDSRTDADGRAHSTAIHFLLARGERSHWHRIDAVEIWHYYAGSALTLQIADDAGQRSVRLGPDLAGRRSAAGGRACAGLAGGRVHRRLDAGGMHGCAWFRFCEIRTGAEGMGACRLALPEHIPRRDQAAAGDQHGGDRDVRARSRKAGQNQERRREQRRRVGRGAEHADVAALHADVPGIKCGADRADAERGDRQPLRHRVGPYRFLDQPVHQGCQQRGRRAKARHRVGRHRLELARHHRIGRPYEGRDECRDKSGHLAGREIAETVAGKQQHRAGEAKQGADDVVRRQPLARQQRREQHDQQRPEIIEQSRLGRRREAQREEIQRVIAEQAADPDDPRQRLLPQGAKRLGAPDPGQAPDQRADRECHRRKLKGGNFSGRHRQRGQERPHQDRGQSDQRGGAGGH